LLFNSHHKLQPLGLNYRLTFLEAIGLLGQDPIE
jgi:hypothetical protein